MSQNVKSISLMIAAMGCLTLTDMLIKITSKTLPIGQVMMIYGIGALAVFWALLHIKREPIQLSLLTNPAVVWRNVGDLIAMNSMFLALVYVPLSTIGAVIQAVPIAMRCRSSISSRDCRSKACVGHFHWFFGNFIDYSTKCSQF